MRWGGRRRLRAALEFEAAGAGGGLCGQWWIKPSISFTLWVDKWCVHVADAHLYTHSGGPKFECDSTSFMGPNAAGPSPRSGEASDRNTAPTDSLQSFVFASIV